MDYELMNATEVPLTDLSTVEEVPPDLDVRALDAALGAEDVKLKLWYFEPGEEITYHAHERQEELYYVLEGEFSVKIGPSGETETREVGPGAVYRAGPKIGHGHRYVGDDRGVVLAIGAPAIDDPGIDPHEIDPAEVEEG